MNIKPLIEKTIYHLRTNGITPTVKKVLRRLSGTNWLPYEEDHLYVQPPFAVPDHELWQMPAVCVPYESRVSVVIPSFNGAHDLLRGIPHADIHEPIANRAAFVLFSRRLKL